MSKILSISAVGHDCGVAYIVDGEIKHCFAEERFTRIKGVLNQMVFPTFSLQKLLEVENISLYDDDLIIVMPKMILSGFEELKELSSKKLIQLYEHHYSHACSSYYISGFKEDTLIITYDGGDSSLIDYQILTPEIVKEIEECGVPIHNPKSHIDDWYKKWRENPHDLENFNPKEYPIIIPEGKWTSQWKWDRDTKYTVSIGSNNNIDLKYQVSSTDSIASLWHDITDMLGYVGGKDEGKLVGLAAQGKFNQEMYDNLSPHFTFNKQDFRWYGQGVREYFRSLNTFDFKVKQDIAYMLQMFTEQYMLEFVSYFKSKFPDTNKLCLAGGLFANVKLNQKINEYAGFDEIFIAPAMSDEGLALGAAIAKSVELGEFKVKKIKNAFLGIETIDLEEVEDIEIEPLDPIKVASWLKDNKVIGVFANRREWGPRALGGTSIMYNPTDPNAQNYINFRLNRSEVMPFAPVVLDGYEEELFYCYKSKYASEFMTLCYNVKEQWVEKIPGVINIFDGTARPQIAKKDNEPFYSILTEFYNQTGVPSTMNTSFNVHGEPIINTLHEALKHLKNGVIDYLVTNNKIYKLKL